MYIRVKVTPGAKKEYIKMTKEGEFEIAVKEKAERNLANKRVVFLISLALGVSEKDARIVNGHQSGTKLLRIENISGGKP